MAHLDNTRACSGKAYELTLCLTEDEVKILMPLFAKAQRQAREKYYKYLDIQNSGEATTQQQNLLCKYEDEWNAMKSVVKKAEELIY